MRDLAAEPTEDEQAGFQTSRRTVAELGEALLEPEFESRRRTINEEGKIEIDLLLQ